MGKGCACDAGWLREGGMNGTGSPAGEGAGISRGMSSPPRSSAEHPTAQATQREQLPSSVARPLPLMVGGGVGSNGNGGMGGRSGSVGMGLRELPSPSSGVGRDVFFIGVAGGTASGKTTVCEQIMNALDDQRVSLISMDSFYKTLTEDQHAQADAGNYNFDHPDAIDVDELLRVLGQLREQRQVRIPMYDFKTHSRLPDQFGVVNPSDVVIVEGITVLYHQSLLSLYHMKVFVDTDADERLVRRIKRDVKDRGRDVAGVLEQYQRFVKPAFDSYVSPTKKTADIIIPRGGDNLVAIDMLVQHIRTKLGQHDLRKIYPNLFVLPTNFQIRGMHTIMRDRETALQTGTGEQDVAGRAQGHADFVFYTDRLIRLVVEHGLGHLPFREKIVSTPLGYSYVGVDFSEKICGVSIIRNGEAMESGLRAVCKGIRIGKILIGRSEGHSGKREIIYHKLPNDIRQRHVLLLDAVLSTGNTIIKAVELLLEMGVQQQKIVMLNLICAPEGVKNVLDRFPHMRIVTTEIDHGINEENMVIPGVGDFGDRYYGTL